MTTKPTNVGFDTNFHRSGSNHEYSVSLSPTKSNTSMVIVFFNNKISGQTECQVKRYQIQLKYPLKSSDLGYCMYAHGRILVRN